MRFDWSTLGQQAPTALVRARHLAHHAVQWVTKAARANLAAAPDDSHSSLEWDAERAALISQPLPTSSGDVRIGLHLASFELIILRGGVLLDTYALEGKKDGMTGVWFDSALRALGLKPASHIALPYSVPHSAILRSGAIGRSGEAAALAELARWYAAAAEVLTDVRAMLAGLHPGPGPARCWPHHFDIATLVDLEEADAETARSIGIGVSPGDESYPQPYVYVSPWPRLDTAELPTLPPPGHWHTQGFVAAVATGEEILALEERGPGLLAFISGAFEIGRARLGS